MKNKDATITLNERIEKIEEDDRISPEERSEKTIDLTLELSKLDIELAQILSDKMAFSIRILRQMKADFKKTEKLTS
jgi:hypothetical protein